MTMNTLPVAVIGAGPVGLAAAAHLVSRGETPVVLEAGTTVGASIREWGHVRLFSPWRYVIDPVSVAMLGAAGWSAPPAEELPAGDDLVDRYLLPLARLPQLAPHIRLGRRVVAITRQGFDKMKTPGREEAPFVLRVQRGDGGTEQIVVRAVIDASGTWTSPNPLGANGLLAVGETWAVDRIAYGIPDVLGAARDRYAGRRVLVAGSGHSAFNALLDLVELASQAPGTRITWAIRGSVARELYGGGEADALPARGALGQRLRRLVQAGAIRLVSGFRIAALRETNGGIEAVSEVGSVLPADEVIAATGFRPDLSLTGELRLALDPVVESPTALAPLIDPNVHSCGTVPPHGFRELSHPEPNFYTVGMKSYGRAPTFLLLTGYEQVRSVVAQLVGDTAAAARVELVLPETGVCSAPAEDSNEGGCCGDTPAFVRAGVSGAEPPSGGGWGTVRGPQFDVSSIPEPSAGNVAAGCCGGPAPETSGACCAQDAEAKADGRSGCGCGEAQDGSVSSPAPAGVL